MKFFFKDRMLVISDFTSIEKDNLTNTLTWDSEYSRADLKDFIKWYGDDDGPIKYKEYKDLKKKETLLKEKDGKLYTFWGLGSKLKDLFPDAEVLNTPDFTLGDRITTENDILEGITLYDFQVKSIDKCLYRKFGNVVIPTGGGKTLCILAFLKKLDQLDKLKKALIIVPTITIGEQFLETAYETGFSKKEIKKLFGGIKNYEAPVTVAVVNTISEGIKKNDKNVLKLLEDVNVLILDEAHHQQANSYYSICKHKEYDYIIGFSGSLFHNVNNILNSYHDAFLYGYFGEPLFKISSQYLRELGLLSQPFVCFENVPGTNLKYKGRFNSIYDKFIVKNETRNNMILKNIMSLLERGLSIIVMVQRKEHGIKLLEGLNIENSLCVYGGRYGYIMENNQAVPISINYDVFRKDFNEGNYKVAIISQVGDEGLNLPNCNAMILAGGGKSRIKVLQRLGRVIRRKDRALNHSYIIDFIDNTHVYLRSQSYSRKKIYEEEGCIICKDRYSFINTIYKDFKDV